MTVKITKPAVNVREKLSELDSPILDRLSEAGDGLSLQGDLTVSGTGVFNSGDSGATANTNADDLVVESSGTGGIGVLVPDANIGYVGIGSVSNSIGTLLSYDHTNNRGTVGTNAGGDSLRLVSGNGAVTITLDSNQNATFVGQILGHDNSTAADQGTLHMLSAAPPTGSLSSATIATFGNISTTSNSSYVYILAGGTGTTTGNSRLYFGDYDTPGKGYIGWGHSGDAGIQLNASGSDDLVIDTSGDVGIGTAPSYGRLHIFDDNSDINMDSNASGQLHIDGNGYNFGIALNADGAQIYTNSANRDLIFGVNETEVARVTPSGIAMAAGNGIDFSASEGSGATSSILDDYEEGTFTGTLDGQDSSPSTAVTETGRYTKIGRMVHATIAFEAVNTTGASGDVEITGWPFSAAGRSSVTLVTSGVVSSFQTINVLSDTANLAPFFETATKLIFLETRNSAVAWGIAEHSAGTNRYLYIAVDYEAA